MTSSELSATAVGDLRRELAEVLDGPGGSLRQYDVRFADVFEALLPVVTAWTERTVHARELPDEILAERRRQDATWGEQNHPDGTGLFEYQRNAAEAGRAFCQRAAELGKVTWRHILFEEVLEAFAEPDPAALRAELVQVAAVATQWVEAIDRREQS